MAHSVDVKATLNLLEEEENFTQTKVHCMGPHSLSGSLSRQGLNPSTDQVGQMAGSFKSQHL